MGKIVQFDKNICVHQELTSVAGASRWEILKLKARELFGWALQRALLPGFVESVDLVDPVSGQHLLIASSPYFTRISINGRDYYFDRITGKFDGTGSGCSV